MKYAAKDKVYEGGEETVVIGGRQKYCRKCAHEKRLAASREYERAAQAKKAEREKEIKVKCIKCALRHGGGTGGKLAGDTGGAWIGVREKGKRPRG